MFGWQKVDKETPPPHRGVWTVFREGVGQFQASVCYGMHEPWWVPRNGFTGDESEPTAMLPNDRWTQQPDPMGD